MANLKSLAKDTAIYGLSSIVGRFLNYLLVPLYTHYMPKDSGDYGISTNIYAYTALILVLLTFGMETTLFRFANDEKCKPDTVFSTVMATVSSLTLVFLLLIFGFITPISSALGYAEHPDYLLMMAVVVALDALQAIPFSFLRFQKRPIRFASLKMLFVFLNIALNVIYFVLLGKTSVFYVFFINLLCTGFITFFFIPDLFKIRWHFDGSLLRRMLSYSWPILILGIAGILNQVADKIIYRHLVPGPDGEVQLGIYGACVKIAMIMALITQAFRYAYEPFVFGGGRSRESRESQAAVMKYFVIFALLAFLVVMAYLDIFKYIIHSGYWEGLRAVPVVMMAEILMSVYFNLSFWYKLAGKTWWGAVFSAAGCVVLLAVNIFGVPRFGYMACAWGGVAGYGVCVLLSYCVGHKLAPVPYDVKRILAYFVLALSLYGLSVWFRPEPLGWRLAWNTLLVAVYFAAALWFERELWLPALRRKKG